MSIIYRNTSSISTAIQDDLIAGLRNLDVQASSTPLDHDGWNTQATVGMWDVGGTVCWRGRDVERDILITTAAAYHTQAGNFHIAFTDTYGPPYDPHAFVNYLRAWEPFQHALAGIAATPAQAEGISLK